MTLSKQEAANKKIELQREKEKINVLISEMDVIINKKDDEPLKSKFIKVANGLLRYCSTKYPNRVYYLGIGGVIFIEDYEKGVLAIEEKTFVKLQEEAININLIRKFANELFRTSSDLTPVVNSWKEETERICKEISDEIFEVQLDKLNEKFSSDISKAFEKLEKRFSSFPNEFQYHKGNSPHCSGLRYPS